jgi:hypothetical protein
VCGRSQCYCRGTPPLCPLLHTASPVSGIRTHAPVCCRVVSEFPKGGTCQEGTRSGWVAWWSHYLRECAVFSGSNSTSTLLQSHTLCVLQISLLALANKIKERPRLEAGADQPVLSVPAAPTPAGTPFCALSLCAPLLHAQYTPPTCLPLARALLPDFAPVLAQPAALCSYRRHPASKRRVRFKDNVSWTPSTRRRRCTAFHTKQRQRLASMACCSMPHTAPNLH